MSLHPAPEPFHPGPGGAHRAGGHWTYPAGSKPHAPASGQRDLRPRPNVAAMGAPLSPDSGAATEAGAALADAGPALAGPVVFGAATAALRHGLTSVRPEVTVRETTAPSRVAPHAFALAASLAGDEDDVASGRFVLLFDQAGHAAWEGSARLVCYARATVEPEVAADPMLPEVAWSWLVEALAAHGAGVRALGGTVTTTTSRRFGVLAPDGDSFDVEVRCSWSPDWAETVAPARRPGGDDRARPWTAGDTTAHLHAFADLLAAMAGLPPRLAGVVPLPGRRF
ncbi:DUF3000 domain-containing protein [Frankia sp. AgB1.9]|nr:DUF3000 domain-containing protein [Frankia sp. AgW1.1]MBL7550340.1 DUF3000 domain-containing protein [Frankia sp. AgB1.9]MBL7621013.1 DUF3000 domain-containing protein [Frankia sp. AgB1.8]